MFLKLSFIAILKDSTAIKSFGEDGRDTRGVTAGYDESNPDIRVYKDEHDVTIISDDGTLSPDEVAKTIDDYFVNTMAEALAALNEPEVVEPLLAPSNPEDYSKIIASISLSLEYQEQLSEMIQAKYEEIHTELNALGWEDHKPSFLNTWLRKGDAQILLKTKTVGEKSSPVQIFIVGVDGNFTNYDLTQTSKEFAKLIDLVNRPKTNEELQSIADKDYLESMINGTVDFENGEAIEAELFAIAERLTPETEPLFEKAVDAYADYQVAQSASI